MNDCHESQGRDCEGCRQATRSVYAYLWQCIRHPRPEWVAYAVVVVAMACAVFGGQQR